MFKKLHDLKLEHLKTETLELKKNRPKWIEILYSS